MRPSLVPLAPRRAVTALPLAAALLAGWLSPGAPAQAATGPALVVSATADRAAPVALSGATVAGSARIFLTGVTDTSRVAYYVDGSATPVRTRWRAPYDLAGTRLDGMARPLSVLSLPAGPHRLRALVTGAAVSAYAADFTLSSSAAPGFGPGYGRPFAADSAWNAPIAANPALDPGGPAMVSVIARQNRAYALLYEFGMPIYNATSADPTYRVQCTMAWGTCDLEERDLHIPTGAAPNSGSDGGMVVVDFAARLSCDFWQARRTSSGGWETSWGTCASIDGDGSGPRGGGTGGGVNGLTGIVRTYEIRAGVIPHALSFATDNSCTRVFRYPATKTDGASSRGDCIPEGARVQLDPSLDVDAIPGITPGERAVAKALQTYGAYNRDNAGAPMAFAFEKPVNNESDPYPSAGFPWDYYDMPHIPWTSLRVLRSWNGS